MMKKSILLAVMMVALSAVANDRLYIEDFSIEIGETKQVSIILENTAQYTAFQTDIYLPEGLTVEKEDDEYAFELTFRKSRDHVIFGEDRPDGAIRLMSYSMQVKPFTGNDGNLVTFNITASTNFSGGAIELKHTLFTDMNDQEISFAYETCQVQLLLKDLTGEILISEESGGGDTNVYIKYTGNEDVDFSISVNGYDILNNSNEYIIWDNLNNLFIIDLHKLEGFGNFYTVDGYDYDLLFSFFVTVSASGYNSIENYYDTQYTVFFTPDGPSIEEYLVTDLSFFIIVCYSYSVHDDYCGYQINDDVEYSNWDTPIYAVERLDHDYYITVTAGQRSSRMPRFGYTTETFLIPARTCNISISKSANNEVGENYYIIQNGDFVYLNKDEMIDTLGGSFANCIYNGFGYLVDDSLSITIDGQLEYDSYDLYNGTYAINLLPYGDIYGGEHTIETTVKDMISKGYYSLSSDTVLAIHPVETRLTADAFVLDMNPDMGNLVLRVDGQKVELSTDGQTQFYAFERLAHDYTATAQVGVKLFDESLEFWSQETTIVVPANLRPGDVNGDGIVNVNDVTILIKKILGVEIEPFITGNADLTGEGTLNVADVTALIQMILNN